MKARSVPREVEAALLVTLLGLLLMTGAAPPAAEPGIKAVQAITYEEIAPYFEAQIVAKEGGRLYQCKGVNNFSQLKRNALLESVAELALRKFSDAGHMVTPHIPGRTFSAGESPWGAFSIPELREIMLPILEKAKQEVIETLQQKRSDR